MKKCNVLFVLIIFSLTGCIDNSESILEKDYFAIGNKLKKDEKINTNYS